MDTSTLSSKFQIVIPKSIREKMKLTPGQKVVFIPYRNSARLVIVPAAKEAFGSLKGIDTTIERDEDERP